ncbi:MAG: HD domain-containing protein, partial [Bacillota bacterium]
MSFEDLKAQLSGYMSEESVERVREAYDYAARAHRGQIRESGVKYIEHPLCVAQILADLDMDADTLAAALLHDVVEDSEASVTDIREEFGEHVADLYVLDDEWIAIT